MNMGFAPIGVGVWLGNGKVLHGCFEEGNTLGHTHLGRGRCFQRVDKANKS